MSNQINPQIYERLLRGLIKNDLREMLKEMNKIVGRPVMLMSADYCWAMVEPQLPIGDIVYDYALNSGVIYHDFLFGLEKLGCVQTVEKSNKIVYLDWGLPGQYPRVLAKLVENGMVEGYLSVPFMEHDYSPDILELIQLLADVSLRLIKNQKSIDSINSIRDQHNQLRSLFLKKLFEGQIKSLSELNEWNTFSDLTLKNDFVVGHLMAKAIADNSIVLREIKHKIDFECAHASAIVMENTIYVLFTNLHKNGVCENETETVYSSGDFGIVADIAQAIGLKMGLSNVFNSLLNIERYRDQAKKAILLGMEKQPEQMIYSYSDYIVQDVFSTIKDQGDISQYLHPMIEVLNHYDHNKGTEYLLTLKCYILSVRNKIETMNKMHIHRNTLDYRLQKIQDITGTSLEDDKLYALLMVNFLMLS